MIRFGFRGALGLSLFALAGLVLLLAFMGRPQRPAGAPAQVELVLYCAAGLQPPVSEILTEYGADNPVSFQTQFAGSGALLSEIQLAGGDLFVAADRQYLDKGQAMNLVGEILPIATQTPVIVVRKGNPKTIRDLNDLLRSNVQISLADSKLAAIGKVVESLIGKEGRWERLWKKSTVHRETVNQVANDVKLMAADAGIVWDATAVQYPDLEMVHIPVFDQSKNEIAVGILTTTKHPTQSLEFARYLTGTEQGLRVFRKYGYQVASHPPRK